jgi:integrase
MASILKIGKAWRAQIRRKGYQTMTETFPNKTLAVEWARGIEAQIDARRFNDKRGLEGMSVGDLIDRYNREIGGEKGFGKNKTAVLRALRHNLGKTAVPALDDDALIKHVKARLATGAGGVTIGIELTYLTGVLNTAKDFWKLPVSLEPVKAARASLKHLRVRTKSKERDRRPTTDELDRLKDYFDAHSTLPMREIIDFAVATAMRAGEITRLRWADLNRDDKTIIIKDRKHPTEKEGNDEEVPLLGVAYKIATRQPEGDELIFPYKEKTISSIFPRACAALKIKDLRFHDLRHEGISRLFEQGYAIEQVALISGHKDWKMLARYTQIRAKDLHRK